MRSRTGRASGAPLEPQVVQDYRYLGYDRHQQELVNLRWKPWNEQRFTSMMAYAHLEETKRHIDSEAEPRAVNQCLRKTPGEEDQKSETSVQQLVPLGSTDEVELPAKEMKKWSGRVNYKTRTAWRSRSPLTTTVDRQEHSVPGHHRAPTSRTKTPLTC